MNPWRHAFIFFLLLLINEICIIHVFNVIFHSNLPRKEKYKCGHPQDKEDKYSQNQENDIILKLNSLIQGPNFH